MAERIGARAALSQGVMLLDRNRRAGLTVAGAAVVALVGGVLAVAVPYRWVTGAELLSDGPRSHNAEMVAAWCIVGLLLALPWIAAVAYGAFAVLADSESGVSATSALRASSRRLLRDVWWVVPALWLVVVAAAFVVPAIPVIASLAPVGAARSTRRTVRPHFVGGLFWRMCGLGLPVAALSLACWVIAALVVNLPSPTFVGSAAIMVVAVAVSVSTMAWVAAASVALLDDVTLPASAAPPDWPPPVPMSGAMFGPPSVPMFPPLPRRPLRTAGLVLVTIGPLAAATMAGLMVMGDPGPVNLAGVTRQGGMVTVVTALCPGDRLTTIELRSGAGSASSGLSSLVWRVRGRVDDPGSFVLGDTPVGMVADVPLTAMPRPDRTLVLSVVTDAGYGSSAQFRMVEVPADGVLVDGVVYESAASFRHDATSGSPCHDADDREWRRTVMVGWLSATGAFVIAGGAVLFADRRRVRRR